MAGQIIKRGDKWLVRVFQGRDAGGKRIYTNRTINGNKRSAEKVLADLLQQRDVGPALSGKLLVSSLLDDLVSDYRINGKSIDWCEMVVRVHATTASRAACLIFMKSLPQKPGPILGERLFFLLDSSARPLYLCAM